MVQDGLPLLVKLLTRLILRLFSNAREVSTAFTYFLDNNKDVWIDILDGVEREYLDKLLLEIPVPTCPRVSAMSPEKV